MNEQTNHKESPVSNEVTQPAPADNLIPISLAAILQLASESGGKTTEKAALALRQRVLDPDSRTLAAIEAGAAQGVLLVELMLANNPANGDDRALTLTAEGWKAVLAEQQQRAVSALASKDDELDAYRRRVEREHELANEVAACESTLESAKARVSCAKDDLSMAHDKLAAFVRGDVQTSFIRKDGQRSAYERGLADFDPAKPEMINPFAHDPQAADWQRGYDEASAKAQAARDPAWFANAPLQMSFVASWMAELLMPDAALAELKRGKELSVAKHLVRAYERDYLLAERSGDAFLALPLYDRDEWAQLHEAEFGGSVEGTDQTDEARSVRQAGGELCGRVVKVGRKKLVIGPIKDGLKALPAQGETNADPEEAK